MPYTLATLTKDLDVIIEGDPTCLIEGVCTIQQSKVGCISFLSNPLYQSALPAVQAAAVILTKQDAVKCPVNKVITTNPYYVYAKIAAFFAILPTKQPFIHQTAIIGKACEIHPSVYIGPYTVIGNGVTIEQDVVIDGHCTIEDGVSIGAASYLKPTILLAHHVIIGKRVQIASGVVIGKEGFGFAQHNDKFYAIPHLGTVTIGDDVYIGANTTIDRGTIDDTVIGNGVKLDNHIQIAHNVQIGDHTIIAGCTGIAGTTTIGKQCMIGGGCAINGHIHLVDHVLITGKTVVGKSILKPGTYSSGILNLDTHRKWLRFNAKLRQIDRLLNLLKILKQSSIAKILTKSGEKEGVI